MSTATLSPKTEIHPSLLAPQCPYCGTRDVTKINGVMWSIDEDPVRGTFVPTVPHIPACDAAKREVFR